MADKKISQLTATTSAGITDVLPIVQTSTKKITWNNLMLSITKVGTIATGVWNGTKIAIAYGGTNSSTALNNNRLMISSGGAIVEHFANIQDCIAYYNGSGLPTGNTVFQFNGTNMTLGIAVTSAGAKMHVKGSGSGTNKVLMAESAGVANAFYVQENGKTLIGGNNSYPASLVVTCLSGFNGLYVDASASLGATGLYVNADSGNAGYFQSDSGVSLYARTTSGNQAAHFQQFASSASKYGLLVTSDSAGAHLNITTANRIALRTSTNNAPNNEIQTQVNATGTNGVVLFNSQTNQCTSPAIGDGISNQWLQLNTSLSGNTVLRKDEMTLTDATAATGTSKWSIFLTNSGTLAEKFSFTGQGQLYNESGDFVAKTASKGLVLKDTQGTPHYWRVTIDNSGTLVTTDLGTTLP